MQRYDSWMDNNLGDYYKHIEQKFQKNRHQPRAILHLYFPTSNANLLSRPSMDFAMSRSKKRKKTVPSGLKERMSIS